MVDGPTVIAGPDDDARIGGQQERGRVRVRVREREIAAQRADAADPDVGEVALQPRERRPAGADERRALDLAVGHGGTDAQHPVGDVDAVQLRRCA